MTTAFNGSALAASAYLQPLLDFVENELAIDEEEEITPDTALLDLGIVDSMAIVVLVTFIEEEFGLHVAEDAAHARHLRNVRSMADWLETLRPTLAGRDA